MFGIGCGVGLLFPHQLIPMMIAFLLVGVGFAGGMYLIPLMNGDIIDADEHMTGLRREGMYAGVNSFVTKPAMRLAQAVFLGFLSRAGYDQSLTKGCRARRLKPASCEHGFSCLPCFCSSVQSSFAGTPLMVPAGKRSRLISPSCTERRRGNIWPNTV
jgi:Na+/melibiose symporter-like transporter